MLQAGSILKRKADAKDGSVHRMMRYMDMKVGLQLYSVRNHMKEDPVGTLKKVSEMGYRYIETYSHPEIGDPRSFGLGLPVREAKDMLDSLGLQVVGCHFYPLLPESLDEYCEYYAELGLDKVGCGGTWATDIENKAPYLELAGRIAKKHGLKYYYHNHNHEYRMTDGEYILHRYFKETDPELVFFELDLFWIARAGLDPVAEMEYFRDRLLLIHQKDFAKDAGEPLSVFDMTARDTIMTIDVFQKYSRPECFTEVGTGVLPIQEYINKAASIGVSHILLEQDYTKMDEIDSIRTSMEAFRRFEGIEWD